MQRIALCRSRRELHNEYLLAKIGVDTAENEPLEVWGENYSILFIRVLSGDASTGDERATGEGARTCAELALECSTCREHIIELCKQRRKLHRESRREQSRPSQVRGGGERVMP